jgi:uncharacterized membrane protein
VPEAAPVTPPVAVAAPPPPPAPGAPRKKGGSKVLIVLIVLSVLVIAGVGVLAFLKKGTSTPAGNEINAEAPAENGATTAPGENFSQEAVLQGDAEFANVRAGPAADSPIVARVNAGEPFNTYTQDGIWWRVKIAGGLIGYLERANIRTRDPVGVPPLQPGNETAPANGVAPVETPPTTPPGQTTPPTVPGQTTPPPQQQRPPRERPPQDRPPRGRDPRINNQNAGVMYDYCYGAGAGTPQCRALGLGNRRRQPNK